MAMLGLRFCARAFSSCGKRGPLFIAVRRPLTIAASLVAEHRLQTRRLSNCGTRARLLRGMWDPPRPGLEPVSPALADRFSTTAPPGKPRVLVLRTTKSSNGKQTPVHERFSNLSLCHGCCITIREIQGVEKWTLLLDGRHCKNALQRQIERGMEKCVTNFISTMESNKGTIRELRGHQRNKTDGKETSRNILGCPMVRPHRSPEISHPTCLFNLSIQRYGAKDQACRWDNKSQLESWCYTFFKPMKTKF